VPFTSWYSEQQRFVSAYLIAGIKEESKHKGYTDGGRYTDQKNITQQLTSRDLSNSFVRYLLQNGEVGQNQEKLDPRFRNFGHPNNLWRPHPVLLDLTVYLREPSKIDVYPRFFIYQKKTPVRISISPEYLTVFKDMLQPYHPSLVLANYGTPSRQFCHGNKNYQVSDIVSLKKSPNSKNLFFFKISEILSISNQSAMKKFLCFFGDIGLRVIRDEKTKG